MPVPAKHRSRSKARRNRAHYGLEQTSVSACPKCGKAVKPHTACKFCGNYKGKQVLKIKAKAPKKAKK